MEKKKVIKTFSTEFKKEKVALIEQGKMTVLDLSRIYEVSPSAVYKWLGKYGKQSKTERIVLEKISESSKNIELMKKIAELERIVGKQQLQIIYKESVIECASELLGEDIEKKYNSQQ
jgi:transposase